MASYYTTDIQSQSEFIIIHSIHSEVIVGLSYLQMMFPFDQKVDGSNKEMNDDTLYTVELESHDLVAMR